MKNINCLGLVVLAATLWVADIASASESKILVYGATGRVGSRVVAEARNRGFEVTAVSRRPASGMRQGDILDSGSVRELVAGQDVVVVAVRGSSDGSSDPAKAVQRVAAEVIVNVLREMRSDKPRLIYVGGAGSLEVESGVTYASTLGGFAKAMMPASVEQEIAGHVLTLDYLRTVSDVRWTYISPAKKFGPGERTGTYRIGGDQMLLDRKGKSRISMEDFAAALIDEVETAAHLNERISVAY
jgi:putative NADH-flavin reductase